MLRVRASRVVCLALLVCAAAVLTGAPASATTGQPMVVTPTSGGVGSQFAFQGTCDPANTTTPVQATSVVVAIAGSDNVPRAFVSVPANPAGASKTFSGSITIPAGIPQGPGILAAACVNSAGQVDPTSEAIPVVAVTFTTPAPITVASSADPAVGPSPVTVTIAVHGTAGFATGTVTVSSIHVQDGYTPTPTTIALDGAGQATYVINPFATDPTIGGTGSAGLSDADFGLRIDYSGDSHNPPSTTSFTQYAFRTATAMFGVSAPASVGPGQGFAVFGTVTWTNATGNPPPPPGNVYIGDSTDPAGPLYPINATTSFFAVPATAPTAPGDQTVTVSYAETGGYQRSSVAVPIHVNAP